MSIFGDYFSGFFINLIFTFRPFPFRVENENTGEALSLWHLTSPAPSVPLTVEETSDYGLEVKPSNWETRVDNRRHSFVLRRHAHTGPLLPLHLIPAAIASAVCLLLCKVFIQFLHQNKTRRSKALIIQFTSPTVLKS